MASEVCVCMYVCVHLCEESKTIHVFSMFVIAVWYWLFVVIHVPSLLLLFNKLGGLDEDKYPILTLPEDGLKCLDIPGGFRELITTLLYFKSLSR